MVLHVEPVAHLHAVAVHGQVLAGQCVDDHQRDQLLGEVERAVVVRAVGGDHRQAVGVVPGAHEVVAGGLAGRVRAVGLVLVLFGEGRVGLGERAVDLVGRHMQEAEGRLLVGRQGVPVTAHRFEQAEGAEHVGLHKVFRAVDRAIHMRFRGKVHNGTGFVLGQQAIEQRAVADVALHEDVVRVALERREGLEVARIGQLVEVHDGLVALRDPVEHEIGANEACAAGNQDHGVPCM